MLEELLPARRPSRWADVPTDLEPTGWKPLIDVYETPEETIVVAEVPGVEPTRIELSISGNLLILRGDKEIGELPEAQLQVRDAASVRSSVRSWSPVMSTLMPPKRMPRTVS